MTRTLLRSRLGYMALAVLVSSSGCARNAVFELELDLPPQPAGAAPVFAVVQVRDDADFAGDWSAVERLEGIPLNPSCARPEMPIACDERQLDPNCSVVVSILGDGDFTQRLRARVRFCEDPSCAAAADLNAPEARVEVERALYQGRYTQGRVCIDTVPTSSSPEPSILRRCDVRCRDGDAVMHCRADGSHFCEDPTGI